MYTLIFTILEWVLQILFFSSEKEKRKSALKNGAAIEKQFFKKILKLF